MAKLSFRQRAVATGAASILLAAFQAGCGDGSPGSSSGGVTPFGSPNPGALQPGNSNDSSSTPGSSANGTSPAAQPGGDTPASGGTQPSAESQPGDIPLTPSMQADGTQPSGDTPAGMTPSDMAPPDMAPSTTDPPPATDAPPPTLERPTRGTPNLFTRDLGIPVGEVDAKLTTAVNRYYGIGTNEPDTPVVDSGYRVYYELPQNRNQAFIWTSDTDEVRSEGQSYGMMIAVQMNLQAQFDKLWNFAKTYMQYAPNAAETSWRYCFHWQGTVNRSNANNWAVSFPAGPAPDGDQYFAAALYLADRRWGSAGAVNYEQEADNISHAMITNASAGDNTPLFNAQSNLPVFFPNRFNVFTDPSYNLPAFYEIFAQDGAPADAARWNAIADASRNLIVSSANRTTGLHPDYANFDGTPNTGGAGQNHDQFAYDAWRVIMNMAVDFAWFSNDARFTAQANKYHAFFGAQLNANKDNVVNQIYNLDGSNASGGNSTALTSTLGAGAIASTAPNRLDFVNAAWNVYQQSGMYRYYQESVYILGLLATSGMYGYEWNGTAQ